MLRLRAIITGWRSTSAAQVSSPDAPSPSARAVVSSPMALLPVPVAHGLDVGLIVRVERRRDGDASGEVDIRGGMCARR